jgi:hypothetical protein
MVNCAQCKQELGSKQKEEMIASISGGIMGDEYIDTYFYCAKCGVYTVEVYHDRFSGPEEIFIRGPMPKAEGDKKVALIKQCAEPWNKKCRCDAHRAYFGDSLD